MRAGAFGGVAAGPVHDRERGGEQRHCRLSSEHGTHKTVTARFWPWLEPFFKPNSFNPFTLSPFLFNLFARCRCCQVRCGWTGARSGARQGAVSLPPTGGQSTCRSHSRFLISAFLFPGDQRQSKMWKILALHNFKSWGCYPVSRAMCEIACAVGCEAGSGVIAADRGLVDLRAGLRPKTSLAACDAGQSRLAHLP
jgi:hypothetical protein